MIVGGARAHVHRLLEQHDGAVVIALCLRDEAQRFDRLGVVLQGREDLLRLAVAALPKESHALLDLCECGNRNGEGENENDERDSDLLHQ